MLMATEKNIQMTLEKLFHEVLQDFPSIFLVGIKKVSKSQTITFLVDGDEPLNLKDIASLSRGLSEKVDETMAEDETPFRFDVSTPGADKPLVNWRQYPKHIGRTFKIKLEDQTIEGKLIAANETAITIQEAPSKKAKHKLIEPMPIALDQIKEATIIISFK